jgi:hypothetical protein
LARFGPLTIKTHMKAIVAEANAKNKINFFPRNMV